MVSNETLPWYVNSAPWMVMGTPTSDERRAIEQWRAQGKMTSPVTRR